MFVFIRCRQIVPLSQDEQNKGPFVNYMDPRGEHEWECKPAVQLAFGSLARMISLLAEHAHDTDVSCASSSSSSSAVSSSHTSSSPASRYSTSSRFLSVSSRSHSTSSRAPAISPSVVAHAVCRYPHDALPFSKTVWSNRLREADKRAGCWVDGCPIKGPHQPHCEPVSVL